MQPSVRNGTAGRPGTMAKAIIRAAATKSARGYAPSWPRIACSADPRVPPLETRRPAARETIRAGICETRPSPTDSRVNTSAASERGMPWRVVPMTMPPKMLTAMVIRLAIASPRTNLEAPSIEPKKALSSSSSRRLRWASLSSMSPAARSASIAICLPGMASSVNRAPTSAMRVAPLVMTRKLTMTRMRKTTMPMTKSPLITNCEKPAMTCPAAVTPSWPCARIRRVVAMDSASRSSVAISRMGGKEENSSGF